MSAEAQVRLATAARVPDLGLSLGEMHNYGGAPGQRDFFFAGLSVNLPLFEDAKTGPRVAGARATVTALNAAVRALRNRILAEVAAAEAQVVAEQHLIELHHKLIPLTREALESALSSYAAGRTDFMVVLDSERELQMHKLDLAAHLAAYEQAVGSLEHAVGGELGLVVASEAGHEGEGH